MPAAAPEPGNAMINLALADKPLGEPIMTNSELSVFVPNVTEVELDCGHWITEEMPYETNQAILNWLRSNALCSTGESAAS